MQAFAAEKPPEKSKGTSSSNAAERAVQNTSKKGEKIADRATGATGRGLKKAEKAVNNTGEKIGKWFKDKTD
jgi:hypothetical protein